MTGDEIIMAPDNNSEFESNLLQLIAAGAEDAILVVNKSSTRIERVYDSSKNQLKIWGKLLEGMYKYVQQQPVSMQFEYFK